jgi:hypothetical protein
MQILGRKSFSRKDTFDKRSPLPQKSDRLEKLVIKLKDEYRNIEFIHSSYFKAIRSKLVAKNLKANYISL